MRLPRQEDLNPVKHHIKIRKISVRGPKSPMILIYGFLLINLIGSILLTLPFSTKDGNSDFIISFETGRQNFTKDHSINHIGMLSGVNFNNLHSETFILGGVTIHDSKRTILTNTTTTGTLDIDDSYFSLNTLAGSELNNIKLIPDIGFTAGYSITPQHDESKYYSWDTKSILNLSAYLEDEYNFKIINENNNLNLGWVIDYRKLIFGKEQDYEINGTNATYTQTDDLTEELTFSINLDFNKKISNSGTFAFGFDAFHSTQETSSFQGNINYTSKF